MTEKLGEAAKRRVRADRLLLKGKAPAEVAALVGSPPARRRTLVGTSRWRDTTRSCRPRPSSRRQHGVKPGRRSLSMPSHLLSLSPQLPDLIGATTILMWGVLQGQWIDALRVMIKGDRPSLISEVQFGELRQALPPCPITSGYGTNLCKLNRVRLLSEKRFGIKCSDVHDWPSTNRACPNAQRGSKPRRPRGGRRPSSSVSTRSSCR